MWKHRLLPSSATGIATSGSGRFLRPCLCSLDSKQAPTPIPSPTATPATCRVRSSKGRVSRATGQQRLGPPVLGADRSHTLHLVVRACLVSLPHHPVSPYPAPNCPPAVSTTHASPLMMTLTPQLSSLAESWVALWPRGATPAYSVLENYHPIATRVPEGHRLGCLRLYTLARRATNKSRCASYTQRITSAMR